MSDDKPMTEREAQQRVSALAARLREAAQDSGSSTRSNTDGETEPPLYSPEWWARAGPKPCIWEARPAYWMPGEAWAFIDGAWEAVNSSDVGMSARPVTATALAERFPDTPPLPSAAFKGAI